MIFLYLSFKVIFCPYLFASRIIGEFIVGGNMKDLLSGVDRVEDDLVSNDHIVSSGSQFVERHDVEPGAFVAVGVQVHPHCVSFQQSWQTFVHGQELVGLEVKQLEKMIFHKYISAKPKSVGSYLDNTSVLDNCSKYLFVFRLILFFLYVCSML